MKFKKLFFCAAFLLAASAFSADGLFAQDTDNYCSENWTWGGKFSYKEAREFNLSNRSALEVDGKRNGGISVRGENRSDILVRACVVAWRDTQIEAQTAVNAIRVKTDSVIEADAEGEAWSVSYEILVPREINLKLTANNGGISIRSVDGTMEFYTKNGGISLNDLAGNVNGKTQNGGVSVKLSGNTWSGSGLNVETKNGGVKLQMTENYAANIETGTTNSGFKSDFSQIQPENKKSWGRRVVTTSINGGGAPIRVVTTNGGIKIDSL